MTKTLHLHYSDMRWRRRDPRAQEREGRAELGKCDIMEARKKSGPQTRVCC